MNVKRKGRLWFVALCLLHMLQGYGGRGEEAVVNVPFDSALSQMEADLGVRAELSSGSLYKSGVRDLVVLGRFEAAVRFDQGKPVAIQPHVLVVNLGRESQSWSFVFGLNGSLVPDERPVRRSVQTRGLAMSLLNGTGLPWFPVNQQGEFIMDRIEIEPAGIIHVDGSGVRSRNTDLADEWPLELNVSGQVRTEMSELQVALEIRPLILFDGRSIDAQLKVGGTLAGTVRNPIALPTLDIRASFTRDEIIVSWGPSDDFILQQGSTPSFSAPITHLIHSDLRELRFPIGEGSSAFFRAVRAD